MPTGKDVHQSIRTKLEEVEGRHHAFNDRLHEVEGRIEQCTEERQQLYDRLAHLYLPVLDAKSVATTLKEVQETVQNCFNDKQQKRRQLEEALKRNREDRTASQNQLDQASEAIEAKGRERERIEQSIAGLLAANAAYQQSRAIADQSRQALEVYQSRAKSFAEESRAKRAAYEAEPLFIYLTRRQYGADVYRPNRLIRFLDSWIAEKVDYRANRRNYDQLVALPQFITREIQHQQGAVDKIVAEMRRIEDAAASQFNLENVIREGKALIEKRQGFQSATDSLDQVFAQLNSELRELDSAKDSYHRQALDQMTSFLQGESLASLKAKATATPSPEDDQLVARLEAIEAEIAQAKEQANSLKEQQHRASEQLSQLSRVDTWYTGNAFDTGRSQFPASFNVGNLLSGFLLGQIAESVFRGAIQTQQVFSQPTGYRSSDDYPASNSGGNDAWNLGGWGSGGGGNDSSAGSDIGGSGSDGGSGGGDSGGISSDSFTTGDSF